MNKKKYISANQAAQVTKAIAKAKVQNSPYSEKAMTVSLILLSLGFLLLSLLLLLP